jgi:hypothetical protein
MENQNTEVVKVILSDEDQKILNEYRDAGHPPLAPSTSSAFFELFLNGNTVREIQRLNSAFKLGAILDAQIRYDWDREKDRYIRDLQSKTFQRMVQVQMESASFLADTLSAAHKKYGTALRKYLQTGNEEDLEGYDVSNITSYSKSIDALMKITGQDSKKVKLEGNINQNVTGSIKIESMSDKVLNPETAEKLLAILAEEANK